MSYKNEITNTLDEATVLSLIEKQLKEKDQFYPRDLSECRKNHKNTQVVIAVAKNHPELCLVVYDTRKKFFEIKATRTQLEQKYNIQHKQKLSKLNLLDNIDADEYAVFRVMNPYEGDDKKNFALHPIDKHDTIPFYKRMDQIEEELFPDFIYCRGERNPEHSFVHDKTDSFGVMLIKPKYVDYVNEVIASIEIASGTNNKLFWLESFLPTTNTYLDMKIKSEKEKKIIKENKRFEAAIFN